VWRFVVERKSDFRDLERSYSGTSSSRFAWFWRWDRSETSSESPLPTARRRSAAARTSYLVSRKVRKVPEAVPTGVAVELVLPHDHLRGTKLFLIVATLDKVQPLGSWSSRSILQLSFLFDISLFPKSWPNSQIISPVRRKVRMCRSGAPCRHYTRISDDWVGIWVESNVVWTSSPRV
jgi:hypothetical protein